MLMGRGMLRITHVETGTERRWTLCGRLTGPWVAELRACWERGRPGPENTAETATGMARTIVDLSDVTSIDDSGEKLLSEMRSNGTELVAAGIYTSYLLEKFVSPPANC
jgi:hypothetical protein